MLLFHVSNNVLAVVVVVVVVVVVNAVVLHTLPNFVLLFDFSII